MGKKVKGSADKGYSLEVSHYHSTLMNAYKPDAQLMLSELSDDIDRLRRLIDARSHKLEKKLAVKAG